MTAILTLLLWCAFPLVKRWLAEKRAAASRDRTFKYRRFLTPEQIERRTRILTGWAIDGHSRRALVWLDGIGGIFHEDVAPHSWRDVRIDWLPPLSLRAALSDQAAYDMRVETETFRKIMVVNDGLLFAGIALVVDEEDSTGLRMLCEELDKKLARERHPHLYERSLCPTTR